MEKPLPQEPLWPRGTAMVHCLATAAFSSHVTFAKEGHEGSLLVPLGVANILILEVVLEGSGSFPSNPPCNEFCACDDIFRGTGSYALLCHALLIAKKFMEATSKGTESFHVQTAQTQSKNTASAKHLDAWILDTRNACLDPLNTFRN